MTASLEVSSLLVVNTFDGGVCDFRHVGRVRSGRKTKVLVDGTSGCGWDDEWTLDESKARLKDEAGLEGQDEEENPILSTAT